jgi:hypothetical protein
MALDTPMSFSSSSLNALSWRLPRAETTQHLSQAIRGL